MKLLNEKSSLFLVFVTSTRFFVVYVTFVTIWTVLAEQDIILSFHFTDRDKSFICFGIHYTVHRGVRLSHLRPAGFRADSC